MAEKKEHSFETDDIHNYFEAFGQWHWCDIYREGVRLLNHHFDMAIEEGSHIEDVIAGVAAQAGHGASAAIASMLGVGAKGLEMVASEWLENQDDLPAPISYAQLLERIEEYYKEYPGDR